MSEEIKTPKEKDSKFKKAIIEVKRFFDVVIKPRRGTNLLSRIDTERLRRAKTLHSDRDYE